MENSSFTESILRDAIVSKLELIESGLTYFDKEHYLPNQLGTRGFIDILAKDHNGKLVVIEVKKSDTTSREALHEVFKYLEGIKHNKGLRDGEIRLFIISTHWKELLIPFSSAYHKSSINLQGYSIDLDDDHSILGFTSVVAVMLNNERIFCDHHMLRSYVSEDNLQKGISEHIESFQLKNINDFVLITLVAPEGHREKELLAMEANLSHMIEDESARSEAITNIRNKYPDYRYIIYSATQLQSEQKYWDIIKKEPETYEEVNEIIDDYIDEDRLDTLHDYAIDVVKPIPTCDTAQISYAAKLQNYIEEQGWSLVQIIRGDKFKHEFLEDRVILNELIGSRGTTKQTYSKTFNSENRSALHEIRKEIEYCLEDNKQWQVPILNIIDTIIKAAEKELFKCRIYIYNPMHIIYTIYLIARSGSLPQWAPNFYIIVEQQERSTMYFGGLKRLDSTPSLEQILAKHFEPDLSDLAFSLTWGGYLHHDVEIVNDLGLSYSVYRFDKFENEEIFMEYKNYDFKLCEKTDAFREMAQYLQEEVQVVNQIIEIFEEFFPKQGWTMM